ncbi:hypothetical protein KCU67_g3141, partial [Aureobasidium melanogenum]
MAELRRLLVRDAAVGVIPEELRELFKSNQPTAYSETPEPAFTNGEFHWMCGDSGDAATGETRGHASDIEERARACRQKRKDENAWCQIVEKVLSSCIKLHDGERDFDINNIQS